MTDVVAEFGYLFLGSRMKRLAERLQAEAAKILRDNGFPMQPGHMPLLFTLDERGALSVSEAVDALGVSQPAVTRSLGGLVDLGLIQISRGETDQRQRMITLTPVGKRAIGDFRRTVSPHMAAEVTRMCAPFSGPLIEQLGSLEAELARVPLAERVNAAKAADAADVTITGYRDDLAADFYRINAEWIEAMFTMEQTDRDILERPRELIIDKEGVILFAQTADLGVVGTCALIKAGEGCYELTKMGVLASARGRKVGEYLLAEMLDRARAMGVETLYLLTNTDCASAIHLYEKLGFVHDAAIMERFGKRYERCNVAMSYPPERLKLASI